MELRGSSPPSTRAAATSAVEGWERATATAVDDLVGRLGELGCRHFVYTPVEVDGTLEGPGLDGLEPIAAAAAACGGELIYSGGVGSITDLQTLAGLGFEGIGGVIIGRALYERRFSVAEALSALAAGSGTLMGVIGTAGRSAVRYTVWGRILAAAEVALLLKQHLDRLDSREKRELQALVRKSKGRPANLTDRERVQLRGLVAKLEPKDLAKSAATKALPFRKRS